MYNLRNRFNKLKDEYLEDLMYEEREGWISEANKRNINKLIKSICELNDENFLNFCLKITPDNEIDIDNPEHIMNTLSNCILAPNMTDVYFEILKQILKEINT
ncbi:ABC-three component system protein, partial [Bacillus sp. JJ1127]|uniref:ABC-three component system protein n=1 Tax=Bacillus sp. JJ1127 TaxID=3122952 RepID=UPI002FFDEB55